MGLQVVLVDELPMEFWRKSRTKCVFVSILALVIFLLKILLKSASKSSFFSLWRRNPVLELQFPTPLRVVLLCFATHIVMAASRLLHAVAACVILLSFAAGLRKSYWIGCMKAATVICQQIVSILALVIFLLKILLKSASKSPFFRSGIKIRFWSYNFRRRCA